MSERGLSVRADFTPSRRGGFFYLTSFGAVPIFAFLLTAFLHWFSDLVKPDLEEIRIGAMKRKTPSVLELRLDRCAAAHERNSYAHNLCVNAVLIVSDRNNSRAHSNPGTVSP